MPIFQATSAAAEAPEIEAGIYDALFLGTEAKRIKGGQYTKDLENGDLKLEWKFRLLDDEGEPLYDDGEPIDLTKLTGTGFNIASKTTPAEVKVLKALLTPGEFAAFEAGQGTDEEALLNRKVQVEVFVKENGWPGIGNVIAARKARSSK
jgi:hypothetical protein